MLPKFSVDETRSANYVNTIHKVRDGLRQLGEVRSRDLEISYKSAEATSGEADEMSSAFQPHPSFIDFPAMSDRNVDPQPPRNPDGSVNKEELNLKLAMQKKRTFNPSPK